MTSTEPSVHELIEKCVLQAILQVLGNEYVQYYATSKNRLRPGNKRGTFGDFELMFAIEVFKGHITSLHVNHAASFDIPMKVCTLTQYGLERIRIFTTSKDIGMELQIILGEDDQLRSIVADIRCNDRGILTFTSHEHLEWHTLHNRIPCSLCGYFFNGPKGIRVHQMTQHGKLFSSAQEEALLTEWQIIIYTPPLIEFSPSPSTTKPSTIGRIKDQGILAAYNDDLATLSNLVASKAWNPASEDHNGCNALLWAAGAGNIEVCQYLIRQCKLDPVVLQGKKSMRRNAIHWAARNGHISLCEWLIFEYGVPVDSTTADGTTPFHYAVWNQQLEMCRWLVTKAHCNVHHLNSYGCNATQWSCMTGSVPMMEFLHAHGVDFTLLNNNGHSALHKAAIKGHYDACQWLLERGGLGIRHMQKDSDGFTPMSFALENHHHALGHYLTRMYSRFLHPGSQ